jgi:hypothetical protein
MPGKRIFIALEILNFKIGAVRFGLNWRKK